MSDPLKQIEDWANAGNVPTPMEQRLREIEAAWQDCDEDIDDRELVIESTPWLIEQVRKFRARMVLLREVLNCRAGRLLLKGIPFFVVKASEPYARQVVDLIREHEGDAWTEEDEAWAQAALQSVGESGEVQTNRNKEE